MRDAVAEIAMLLRAALKGSPSEAIDTSSCGLSCTGQPRLLVRGAFEAGLAQSSSPPPE